MDYNELIEGGKSTVEFISSSFNTIKVAREALRSPKSEASPSKDIETILRDLEDQLLGARENQLALVDALLNAKQEMVEFDRTLELKRTYEPFETGGGSFVLCLRDEKQSSEQSHYICPDCAENGKRSFLQPKGTGKICGPCNSFFHFVPEDNRSISTSRRRVKGDFF